MANRRYSEFKEKKIGPNYGSPPSLNHAGEVTQKFDKESPVPFPGAPGPKGRDLNSKAKFPRIKDAVKKDY